MNKPEEEKKRCENCINFDDGICDATGWVVDDDDLSCKGKYWEREFRNDRK